jgi:hypothetical protein
MPKKPEETSKSYLFDSSSGNPEKYIWGTSPDLKKFRRTLALQKGTLQVAVS